MNTNDVAIQQWTGSNLTATSGVAPHTFSAGEPHLNIAADASVHGEHFVITARGGHIEPLGAALIYADALRRGGAASVSLFAPYLPAARQDRGAPFSAKVVADLINLGGFDHVIAVDPHSAVMPELIERFVAIPAEQIVPSAMIDAAGDLTVIAPDAGAAGRARAVAARFGLALIQADKHRDPAQNFRITEYVCPKPSTEYAIVIDDICDGGGTFLALADAIDMPAERLRLWTSHGIYSRGIDVIRSRYGLIGSTDSMPSAPRGDIVVELEHVLTTTLATLTN